MDTTHSPKQLACERLCASCLGKACLLRQSARRHARPPELSGPDRKGSGGRNIMSGMASMASARGFQFLISRVQAWLTVELQSVCGGSVQARYLFFCPVAFCRVSFIFVGSPNTSTFVLAGLLRCRLLGLKLGKSFLSDARLSRRPWRAFSLPLRRPGNKPSPKQLLRKGRKPPRLLQPRRGGGLWTHSSLLTPRSFRGSSWSQPAFLRRKARAPLSLSRIGSCSSSHGLGPF